MASFAHLVNPFRPAGSADLPEIQQISLETIRRARNHARGEVAVQLISAQFAEDEACIPADFKRAYRLERSILDLAEFRIPRKLPLLPDILDRLYQESSADYLIYSNMDIALQPYFYSAVSRLADRGLDAFVINRRTIPPYYSRLDQIPAMQSEVGKPHEGWDCFVFHRSLYPRFQTGMACLGIPGVGRILLWNLLWHGKRFFEFRDLHLTFHIGNDPGWDAQQYSDYARFNTGQLRYVLDRIRQHIDIDAPGYPHRRYFFDIASELGLPDRFSFRQRVLKRLLWKLNHLTIKTIKKL